jgi:[glutamine synthetase] adenylyltransferase / [glutamine synthetase]-adenylyl-L-tyrosine phosphorylase
MSLVHVDEPHADKLQDRLKNLAAATVDPPRALYYLTELQARLPHFLTDSLDDRHQQWLVTIFSYSRFLSEELLNRPEGILSITDVDRTLSQTDYHARLTSFLTERAATRATSFDLSLFRRRELLRIVLRDALALATLSELTEELSNLAEAILACVLQSVRLDLEARYGIPMAKDATGKNTPATFTVVALGKLGGRELNYSSDVDLMFLYSGNGETDGRERISNKEFFHKLANRSTDLLSTYTAAGLCYRVDLRLRPEGTLGDICISLAGAKEYYEKRARDWELQMLIKARVAAGDETLGRTLLDFVEPHIYSTSLDFSAIETVSATRIRISEKLAARQLGKNGFDVKLARGGIRDIEFLVQCLQRLHGGREVWVRHGGTLLALSRLLDKDLLSQTEYSRLANAYQFLRHLEHRLQFEDDRQTHTLPSNPQELERLARRMPVGPQGGQPGTDISVQLMQDLNQHFENVQVIYDRIVYAQRPLNYTHIPPEPASQSYEEISPPAPGILPEHLRRSLDQAAPHIAERLQTYRFKRSQRTFEVFLERLLEDPPFLDLLSGHPVLTDYVVQIFELSPFLSEQLIRRPELLEEVRLVADEPNRRWAFEGLAAPLNDIGALRRFFRREMLRIQAASICLREPVFQTLDRTSALAEFVIARSYRIALEAAIDRAKKHASPASSFEEPQDEMIVVALGRLGMREFDLGSDADLTFIIPDSEAGRLEFWTHVAEGLIEILTAYTGDGTILSLDTRLRPNGREGLLVQTESACKDYFATKAEAWEGIAYMKARGVAGNLERATYFLSELQQVDWRRYGQSGRSKQDLRLMRARLQREQGEVNPLKAGSGGFYDADFILMYLRLKGAGLFFKSLNTPERIDIVEKMGHLDRADAAFLLKATTFYRALDHALRIVTGQPREKLLESPSGLEMLTELTGRWTSDSPIEDILPAELRSMQNQMRRLFDRIFY